MYRYKQRHIICGELFMKQKIQVLNISFLLSPTCFEVWTYRHKWWNAPFLKVRLCHSQVAKLSSGQATSTWNDFYYNCHCTNTE